MHPPSHSSSPLAHGGQGQPFRPLGAVIVAVSDTRDLESDRSGALLEKHLRQAGHEVINRVVIADEIEEIQAEVRKWVADTRVQTVLVTGGTGVTERDVTPEALEPIFDKQLPGFGELFRHLSLKEIGTAAIQSRAMAGTMGNKVIWAIPGSTGACRLAIQEIILPQLDSRTRPCSFATLLA
jgi:molybdopterin adenylyltransferase